MRIDQTILLTIERVLRGLRRRLRGFYYSRVLKSIGTGCQICDRVLITGHENISLGDRVVVNEHVVLQSCEGASISLGNHVVLSFGAMLLTGGIDLEDLLQERQHTSDSIVIDDFAWIGANAIILPGVKVGKCAVVAAGSVVMRDVSADVIVAGSPARKVGRAYSDDR